VQSSKSTGVVRKLLIICPNWACWSDFGREAQQSCLMHVAAEAAPTVLSPV
jgi:hypothetical protein